ncbi:MAG: A24 family peptidase [Desulfurivibrionaceae bacterium]|nr:A24 family peptidase [Desulfurivibrionaceae bacterium]
MSDYRQQIPRYFFGFAALALAGYFLLVHSREPVVFFASLFFLVICVTDTFQSRIPNLAILSLVMVGFGYNLLTAGMPGGATALAGMLAGLALLLPFYLMGGMGGGDVKALAALGALLGPADIFQVFLIAGLIGGGMALVHLAFSKNLKRILRNWRTDFMLLLVNRRLPERAAGRAADKYQYGAAIAFGFFVFVTWGGLL